MVSATKTAASARGQAEERSADRRPHAVLLDIGLPGVDGYEVARRMKAMLPAVRLIALSGYGQPEDKLRSNAAGFDVHLVKPVDVEGLMKVLGAGR
ncbi:MAG TPA: response regulator [Steroidobacteraceae bacterium]|nr:response regulator [Steroidobacteraceae bacterium]